MGLFRRVGIGLSALGAQLGLSPSPIDDAGRVEQIDTLYGTYAKEFSDVESIEVADLIALLERGEVVVVDVRSERERAVSTLPGAVPADAFDPDTVGDKMVVAYCTIGFRSGLWVADQRDQGVQAVNLKGSVLAWTHAGQPLLDSAGKPTQRVHVYGRKWDLARTDYQAVW